MNIKWIIGLGVLLFGMALLSGICEMVYIGNVEQSRLWALLHPEFVEYSDPLNFVMGLFNTAWNWVKNLLDVLTFNYAFFQGGWSILRWMLFMPIGAGIVWGVVSMLRGVKG